MKGWYEFSLPEKYKGESDPPFSALWVNLRRTTTAHGIPRVGSYRGPLKKVIWMLIILGCFAAVTYNTTKVFMDYFAFDVNVDIKITPNVALPFPAVTICNLTPINKQALDSAPGLDQLKGALSNSNKKRRRKRSAHPCPPANIHPASGYCFMANPDPTGVPYSKAVAQCPTVSMEIAIVDTAAKQKFIQDNDLIAGSSRVWLGIEKPGPSYQWNDGSLVVYSNYNSPPSKTNARMRDSDYKWYDADPTDLAVAFCQVYVGVSTTVSMETTTVETTTQPTTTLESRTTTTTVSPETTTTDTITVAPDTTTPDITTTTPLSTQSSTTTTIVTMTTPVTASSGPALELREEFLLEEDVIEEISSLPDEEKSAIGFTAASMILDCQYAGKLCSPSDFDTFYNPVHGNCYMFNSGWNSSRPLFWSKQTGVRYGLQLSLDIQQDNYVKSIGKSAGVRVLIDDQSRMPFPEEDGHHAAPGRVTAFGVSKLGIIRQGQPHSNCTYPDDKNITGSVYEEKYPVHYTTIACMKTCYQGHVMSKCDCADPYVEKYGAAFNYKNVPTCDIRNVSQYICRQEFIQMYTDGTLHCNCPVSCRDTTYLPTISSAAWPSQASLIEVAKDIAPHYLNDTSKIHDNLLKLEIFYNDFNFEEIAEKPAYTWEKLISDLGGSLGLWIGWSILTLFEYIELVTDIIVLAIVKFSKEKGKSARKIPVKPVTPNQSNHSTHDRPTGQEPEIVKDTKHQTEYSDACLGTFHSGSLIPNDHTLFEKASNSGSTSGLSSRSPSAGVSAPGSNSVSTTPSSSVLLRPRNRSRPNHPLHFV